MHNFPFCTRGACALAERSRSADPPQVLGSRSAHGRHSLRVPPPWSHPQVCPGLAPAPAPRPYLTISYIVKRFPARSGNWMVALGRSR
eukprot:5582847-Pleurochrysis_carterae.AAC.1